jgi:calcineurin-like phosphoesterase family protein
VNRYIADLHFGHYNIISFDSRPFSGTEDMEEIMITNWNSVVKQNDTTYILGDFCWGKEDDWIRLVGLLNGNKVLISGNHDLKNMSSYLKGKFADIKDYKEMADNQNHVILSHYPIMFYRNSYNPNCYMLCGHVHTTRENDFLIEWRRILKATRRFNSDSCGNIYNVGCMMPYINYVPRTLEEIISQEHERNKE